MKHHPILFSTPMVQAILEGRKTQTRRVIKPQPSLINDGLHLNYGKHYYLLPEDVAMFSPYGKPGDLLWVRETFAFTKGKFEPYDTYSYKADSYHKDVPRPGAYCTCEMPSKIKDENKCWHCKKPFYALLEISEDGWYDPDFANEVTWKPSIHMPKAACRLWLKIKDVRVERVQDITEADAIAEGMRIPVYEDKYMIKLEDGRLEVYEKTKNPFIAEFAGLWNSLNTKRGFAWNTNAWVWVVEFEVIDNRS